MTQWHIDIEMLVIKTVRKLFTLSMPLHLWSYVIVTQTKDIEDKRNPKVKT